MGEEGSLLKVFWLKGIGPELLVALGGATATSSKHAGMVTSVFSDEPILQRLASTSQKVPRLRPLL